MNYPTKKAFIGRTVKILEQYERLEKELPKDEQYGETLFVNCLMGLLIITKEEYLSKKKYLDRLPKLKAVSVAGTKVDLTRMLILNFRNPVAHYDFELKDDDKDNKIDAIEFTNIAKFNLQELKSFIVKFAKELHAAVDE